jgi:hypothetical protein
MKFQRTDLIQRVRAEIDRRVQAAEQANEKAARKAEQSLKEYVARTEGAWQTFADRINAALTDGRPVTSQDAPAALKDGWIDRVQLRPADYWATPAPREADTAALATLLDLLEAATDDEVTTSSLERMGFRTAQLFRR